MLKISGICDDKYLQSSLKINYEAIVKSGWLKRNIKSCMSINENLLYSKRLKKSIYSLSIYKDVITYNNAY